MSDSKLIVSALYEDLDAAQKAIKSLKADDFPPESFGILAQHPEGEDALTQLETTKDDLDAIIVEDLGTGAAIGGAFGALLGTFTGLSLALIPGVGPALAAGTLGALLGTGAGIGAGGLVGALTSAGMEQRLAHRYAEGLKRGGILVVLTTEDPERARDAADHLERHDPVDLDERSTAWRAKGWSGFSAADETLPPQSEDEKQLHKAGMRKTYYEVEGRRSRVRSFGARGNWLSSPSPSLSTR